MLLVGGGLGNAVLFSIGQELRAQWQPGDLFRRLQEAWSIATRSRRSSAPPTSSSGAATKRRASAPTRPHDRAFVGNIVEAIDAYGSGSLGATTIPLGEVDRVIAIGSDGMMAAVAQARHGVLAPYLKPDHTAIGSASTRRCSA